MRASCFQSVAKSVLLSVILLCSIPVFAQQNSIKIGIPNGAGTLHESMNISGPENINSFLEQYWLIWGEKYGYDVTFQRAPFALLTDSLEANEIDVVSLGAIESQTTQVLASIPFAYSGGALYERLGDKIKGLPVALHIPYQLTPENFNRSQNVIFQSDNTSELFKYATEANYIFTWNKLFLGQELQKSPISDDFVLAAEPKGVPLRFLTHRSNSSLMVDINRGIRMISPVIVEDLWKSTGASSTSLNVVIGEYYQKLTLEQELLLVESPFLTYAYIERGEEPYFISDGFELNGYTIDVLNDITAQLGVTFVGKPYRSFQEALDAAISGEVDVFPGVYRTENRKATLEFTSDIDKASVAIISEQDFYAISDLKGLRIALVRGLHENDIVSNILPNNPVIYLDTAEEAIEAVANGRADAFVGKLLNSIYLVDKHKYYSLNVHKALDVEQDLWPRLAVNKSRTDIRDLLNHGIYSLGDNFQHELSQKWRSSLESNYQNYQTSRSYEQSLMVVTLFTVIAILGMFFYRRQLNRRTKVQNSLEAALFEAKEAKREAEEMALAKSDFLARMSHEIRTPMNGVLGMAEALSFTQLDKEQTDLLQTLNGSARNLMALLNDVLDFSKMDAGKLTLEKVSCEMDSLITGVVGNFKHKAKAKGLKMVSRIDPQLSQNYSCDSTRLMQVLNNLVSNSVKFTEHGYVELTAQLIAQNYNTNEKGDVYDLISIQVRDSGIGIPKEKLRTLFDPFVQADGDITRRFGGTGLGLSISKEIVDSMGGEIKVSSVMDHGSLFNILMPVIRIEEAKATIAVDTKVLSGQSDLSNLRVLFAEDNEVNRKVIGGQLKRLGVQFETAENGLIAYNKYLDDSTFDLVLSDCHMPEMDGFTLAGKISEQRQEGKPYLIAITADALSGAAKRCLAAGFDDYISKPCPLDVLEAKLSNVAATMLGENLNETVCGMLDHQQSFDVEVEQEDDLSWLAEFESVMPQPEQTTQPTSDEPNVDWISQCVASNSESISNFTAEPVPAELPEGIDWLGSDDQSQKSGDHEVLFENSQDNTQEAVDSYVADPLESLLAELEGIGQESEPDTAFEFEPAFDIEDEFSVDKNLAENDSLSPDSADFDFESFLAEEMDQQAVKHDEEQPTSPAALVELPSYQPFNEAAVLTMSGDDLEIAKEILDTFLDNYARDIKELSDAYQSNELPWLKDVAHRIKGSALYLGSDSLSKVAKDLEYSCAEGSRDNAKERVEFIEQYLQVLANEIEMYCETVVV